MIFEEKNGSCKVKPLFFRVFYKNKIAYLLGTIHVISSNVLPDACFDIIKTCQSFIGEKNPLSTIDRKDFQTNFLKYFGRKKNDEDWFLRLSPRQQIICNNLFDAYIADICDEYVPYITARSTKLAIVVKFINVIATSCLPEVMSQMIKQNEEQGHTSNSCNITGEMDFEIADMFHNKYGLERYFHTAHLEAKDECEIDELIDNIAFIEELRNPEKFTTSSEDLVPNPLMHYWERYRNGEYLTDFSRTQQEDDRDKLENNKMFIRNYVFFINMLKHIEELSGPVLIAVGVDHLLGKNGLLMRLKASGIKIDLFEFNNTGVYQFRQFEYYYDYYLRAFESIKKDICFPASRCNINKCKNLTNNDLSKDTITNLKKTRLYGCFV